jgi:hypothetical protein
MYILRLARNFSNFGIRTRLVIFAGFRGLITVVPGFACGGPICPNFDSAHWPIMVNLFESRFAGQDILGYGPYGRALAWGPAHFLHWQVVVMPQVLHSHWTHNEKAWEPDESDYCHHLIVPQMRILWDEAGESRENSCLLISTPHGHWGL